MKHTSILFILISLFAITSCDNDSDDPETFTGNFETAQDILAGVNGFTFFNLRTGEVVTDSNSTNWDLGFQNAGFEIFIITNGGNRGPGQGGGILLDVDYDQVTEVPADSDFVVESAETYSIDPNPQGWWIYTATQLEPNHAVLPKTPHTILVRTANGGYAKLEVISYYQGNPDTSSPEFANLQTRPAAGYFTFNYEVIN
ncbi:MAG: HmuY family protein [Balneolales bacterium]|nr:HmuY family protein [Balneolales bacterium]